MKDMKELLKDLKTGKKRINVKAFVALIFLIYMLALIIADFICVACGMTLSLYGILVLIGKFAIASTCYDYLTLDK